MLNFVSQGKRILERFRMRKKKQNNVQKLGDKENLKPDAPHISPRMQALNSTSDDPHMEPDSQADWSFDSNPSPVVSSCDKISTNAHCSLILEGNCVHSIRADSILIPSSAGPKTRYVDTQSPRGHSLPHGISQTVFSGALRRPDAFAETTIDLTPRAQGGRSPLDPFPGPSSSIDSESIN